MITYPLVKLLQIFRRQDISRFDWITHDDLVTTSSWNLSSFADCNIALVSQVDGLQEICCEILIFLIFMFTITSCSSHYSCQAKIQITLFNLHLVSICVTCLHSRGAYSSACHDCMLFNNPNSLPSDSRKFGDYKLGNGRNSFQANLNQPLFGKSRGLRI